jgi:hypothetical protein
VAVTAKACGGRIPKEDTAAVDWIVQLPCRLAPAEVAIGEFPTVIAQEVLDEGDQLVL